MKNQKLILGDFELTLVSDGIYRADGGAFFGVVPKVLWERKIQPDAVNRLPIGLNSLLVRTGKTNVLIETGIQPPQPDHSAKGDAERSPPVFARPPRNLGQAVNE